MKVKQLNKGQSMTEYMLIVAAIAMAIMGGFNMVGQSGASMVNRTSIQLHASNGIAASGHLA